MERPIAGDVIVSPFPFSNLRGQKLRPALILANAEFGNFILCQITSKPYSSKTAIRLVDSEFKTGKLPVTSYIRPDKLFTAEAGIIVKTAGQLTDKKKQIALNTVRKMFK